MHRYLGRLMGCNGVAWIYDRLTHHSSRDAVNTTTSNLAHLMAHLYICRTMQIYPWQIDPLQSSIDLYKTITPNKFHI